MPTLRLVICSFAILYPLSAEVHGPTYTEQRRTAELSAFELQRSALARLASAADPSRAGAARPGHTDLGRGGRAWQRVRLHGRPPRMAGPLPPLWPSPPPTEDGYDNQR